jgi:hypothetical protein
MATKTKTKKTAASSKSRASSTTTKASAREQARETAVDDVQLSPEQKAAASAKTGTSDIEAGGVEKVKETAIRMESEGVLTPIKSDFDNPESPVVGDPAGALVGPKDPGKVTVGPGETAAQHEAHALMSHPARIAERIELESGPEGLPTDVIARRQQEDIARAEFQRVDGDREVDSAHQARLAQQDGSDLTGDSK